MEYIGTASLKGVICHVIDLQYTVPGTGIRGARWWFAVEDKLPRRYQKVDHLPAGKIMSEFTVSNLRLENTIAATAFAMELPNGYSFQRFTPGASPQPIVVGEAAPDWKLLDKSGREQKLSDNKGKIVVLMFWASWCGYCKLAIPGIQKIYEKYKGRNVEVFGINVQEDEGIDPSDYLKSVKADFPTLLKGDKTGDSYKVKSVPGFYVIDQTVKVVYGKLLFNNSVMSEIEDAIESALNKSKN
jgi:thiol-disulfide isomerase/thioredoxin